MLHVRRALVPKVKKWRKNCPSHTSVENLDTLLFLIKMTSLKLKLHKATCEKTGFFPRV